MPKAALAQFDPSHPPRSDVSSFSDTVTSSLALPLYSTGDYDQGLSHEDNSSLSNTGYGQVQPEELWEYQVEDPFEPERYIDGSGGETSSD